MGRMGGVGHLSLSRSSYVSLWSVIANMDGKSSVWNEIFSKGMGFLVREGRSVEVLV